MSLRGAALNPAPGCFSFLDGQRVKIWQATAQPEAAAPATPGEILEASENGIRVACGAGEETGTLLLEEAQFPGAKALPAAELLRGRAGALAPGNCFSHE